LFAFTGLTMLGIGSLGLFASVLFPKPRAAIMRTYLWVIVYLLVSLLCRLLLLPALGISGWPSSGQWTSLVTIEYVVEAVGAGNWLAQGIWIWTRQVPGVPMDVLVQQALWRYAVFHIALFLATVLASVHLLRRRRLGYEPRGAQAKISSSRPGMA